MAKRTALRPAHWTWMKDFSFDPGVKVGETIWVSGQVALDGDGALVGGDDMRAQAEKVFQNIAEVLAEGGATMNDVVKITAWLTDMSRFAEYNAARSAAFTNKLPASSAVVSPQLAFPNLLVEVEVVAVLGAE